MSAILGPRQPKKSSALLQLDCSKVIHILLATSTYSLNVASELAVLPVHHHDTLDYRGHAVLELLMGRVLADVVVAVLGAGKLKHLCPAQKSARFIMRSSTRPLLHGAGHGVTRGITYKSMSCTVL